MATYAVCPGGGTKALRHTKQSLPHASKRLLHGRHILHLQHRVRGSSKFIKVKAEQAGGSGGTSPSEPQELALAAVKPKSPTGQMLAYYLNMEPHLFREALHAQFSRIQEERDAERASRPASAEPDAKTTSKSELVLYRRMEQLKQQEQRATVEDLMYAAVLERFMELGVEMLPRLDTAVAETSTNLTALTEGIHSKEALEMVKEHVLGVMGNASMAYSNTIIRMSKLQGAQVYAASIMFGYFLRRVDKRFQLERSLGVLQQASTDAVNRLERLFSQADSAEAVQDPDKPSPSGSPGTGEAGASSSGQGRSSSRVALRKYVENFDQQTMLDTARLLSVEAAGLVETQTNALFGSIKELQQQMEKVVGNDATSVEELMKRVHAAVEQSKVEVLTLTVGTQRRAVLEAIAFGTFLRDVETWVDGEYSLLTPIAGPSGPGRDGPPPLAGV